MKKVIFIGKTGSGKTTLCQKLHKHVIEYKKTQAIENFDYAIDTPGEYIENRHYYKALIVTSVDADIVGLVQDCTEEGSYFPPAFGNIFPQPVIGIVTKIDQVENRDKIEQAKKHLETAGAEQIFEISTTQNIGIYKLEQFLEDKK
ncbi:ethanolamine utilization protein EutP [Bacillus cereus]|nr:ethanolamine utilization protein EutP [Bacillus cereus]PGU64928.1 ethanolamine utilization protein EutP [Bacillus cereus]